MQMLLANLLAALGIVIADSNNLILLYEIIVRIESKRIIKVF